MDLIKSLLQNKSAWVGLNVFTLITCITILILSGRLPVNILTIDDKGFKGVLGENKSDNWKPLLAESINKSLSPGLEEIGLFLHINETQYRHISNTKNLGAICIAYQFAKSNGQNKETDCPPETFSSVSLAIHNLEKLGFIHRSRYIKDTFDSFQLNALGHKAFEHIREKWVNSDTEKRRFLSFLDARYPGLIKITKIAGELYASKANNDFK